MTLGLPKTAGSTLTTLLFVTVIVVALYVGREVLVPIALAILMSFVLAPRKADSKGPRTGAEIVLELY